MRNLKVFGVAAVTAFAIGAVAATSALAGAYHSEIETTNITGTQQTSNEFKTDMGTLKCTTVTYTGQLKGSKKAEKDFAAEMLTMSSKYEGCTLAGTKATVTTTECTYTYTIPTSTIFGRDHFLIHNECAGVTTKIADPSINCEINVPTQIFGGVMAAEDLGSGSSREEEGIQELTEIEYSYTSGCPNAEGKAGTKKNGSRSGKIRLKGTNPSGGAQVGFWIE